MAILVFFSSFWRTFIFNKNKKYIVIIYSYKTWGIQLHDQYAIIFTQEHKICCSSFCTKLREHVIYPINQ